MNAEKLLYILWPNKLAWEIQTGLIKLWFNSRIHRLSRTAVSDLVLLISCRELFLDSCVQRMGRMGEGKKRPSPFSFSSEKEGIFSAEDMVCIGYGICCAHRPSGITEVFFLADWTEIETTFPVVLLSMVTIFIVINEN